MLNIHYKASQIAEITHGNLIFSGFEGVVQHLIYDTRRINQPESSVFFALKTAKSDGHLFLQQAYHAGVRVFVVEKNGEYLSNIFFAQDVSIIEVNNSLLAMQQLATYHRNLFSLPVVGITGSNGKTIVKEWLGQLLSPDFRVTKSPNSYNSQIGVPLSVWQLNNDSQMAIFEAGISQRGEMLPLQAIIQPNIGIITNIGTAHAQGFGSDFEKSLEKLNLFTQVQKLFYSPDYAPLQLAVTEFMRLYPETELCTWSCQPTQNADLTLLKSVEMDGESLLTCRYKAENFMVKIPFTDKASIENVLICLIFMLEKGYHLPLIQQRISRLQSLRMRLEQKQGTNNTLVINDGYSLDMSSLVVALDYLKNQKTFLAHTVILSDFADTDSFGKEIYAQIAELLQQHNIKKLVGIGREISKRADYFKNIETTHFFEDTQSFLNHKLRFENEVILLKGARKFEFELIDKFLSDKTHETVLEVNLDAMMHNFNFFKLQLRPKTKIMVMVKAFSYGSGSYELANLLQYHQVDYLAVAYADEGVKLREAGIKTPIMVLNPEKGSFSTILKHGLEPVIFSFRLLNLFLGFLSGIENKPKVPIHIEIDTGMHRLGFEPATIFELAQTLKKHPFLEVVSVFSHLAAAEDAHLQEFTTMQINAFNDCYKVLCATLGYKPLRHLTNTAGIQRYPEAHFEMVRLGIGLHGIDSNLDNQEKLQQVSTLKTVISQVRELKKGETVGYNRKGIVERNSRIATLAIGYADGIDRTFGLGRAQFYVDGRLAPTIGNICMDMCMLDITDVPSASEGTEVVVFGEEYPIQKICAQTGIIPYEMLTNVSERVKRVYVKQ